MCGGEGRAASQMSKPAAAPSSIDAVAKERSGRGTPSDRERPQYPIESVDNALRLLLLFEDVSRIRLTDVGSYLGVATSTAHRLLATLQYRGFVRQDPVSRAYLPGPALNSIASSITRHIDVRARARPILERLNAEVDETVHLGQLDGANIRFLDSIESSRAVRVASRVGRTMPAHCTSTGKAMLSKLTLDELRDLYPEDHLEALTEHSIASRANLERDLERVRRRGYAVSKQESEDGVTSVSVPVHGVDRSLYAINVSVPINRMSAPGQKAIAAKLIDAANELERILL